MNAYSTFFELARDGLTLTPAGEHLRVAPASSITARHRALIADNKPALVALLRNAHQTALDLVDSINRCCDARGDDASNRAALIAESSLLTPHEQVDMKEHFDAEATKVQSTPINHEGNP